MNKLLLSLIFFVLLSHSLCFAQVSEKTKKQIIETIMNDMRQEGIKITDIHYFDLSPEDKQFTGKSSCFEIVPVPTTEKYTIGVYPPTQIHLSPFKIFRKNNGKFYFVYYFDYKRRGPYVRICGPKHGDREYYIYQNKNGEMTVLSLYWSNPMTGVWNRRRDRNRLETQIDGSAVFKELQNIKLDYMAELSSVAKEEDLIITRGNLLQYIIAFLFSYDGLHSHYFDNILNEYYKMQKSKKSNLLIEEKQEYFAVKFLGEGYKLYFIIRRDGKLWFYEKGGFDKDYIK